MYSSIRIYIFKSVGPTLYHSSSIRISSGVSSKSAARGGDWKFSPLLYKV